MTLVEENIHMMKGSKQKGSMKYLLSNESFGGSTKKGCSCGAANFYFDKDTGEIIYFGNSQHVPEQIRERYSEGTFMIAMLPDIAGLEIVNMFLKTRGVSANAKHVLEQSVELYNLKSQAQVQPSLEGLEKIAAMAGVGE